MNRHHLLPLLLLAALALLWTFPLVTHFSTHIPGGPGDNYSFLWNLWWMRRALDSPELTFFHSPYLFAPIGVDLVNHPHTALQAFISATALRGLSLIQAENLYIVFSVFANAVAAYALVFDIVKRRTPAVLGAVIFGGSPYIVAHLLGHFDLLSAWVLPMFALCFRRALSQGSFIAMLGCGVAVSAAAYTAYYYVVYIGLFAVTYLIAWCSCIVATAERRVARRGVTLLRWALAFLAIGLVAVMWIAMTGGSSFSVVGQTISVRTLQNPLTAFWILLILTALTMWRVAITVRLPAAEDRARGIRTFVTTAAVFGVLCAPLIYHATTLAIEGRYVSQTYFWRSGPPGMDLTALIAGNPFHPITGGVARAVFTAWGLHPVEGIAWLGVVPIALLLTKGRWGDARETRCWMAVFVVAVIWALGPRLKVAGFDMGLPLPELLARFVPVVSNARVPGRAMVVAYLALAVLAALRFQGLDARWRTGFWPAAMIALVLADYLGAPLTLTRLEQPTAYQQLALITDRQAVCEVPFGVGDGMGGSGFQDREQLYFATLHGHPLVGGYIGRMTSEALDRYARSEVLGDILQLSNGDVVSALPFRTHPSPCRYFVLDRQRASHELQQYFSTLNLRRLGGDGRRELYVADEEAR